MISNRLAINDFIYNNYKIETEKIKINKGMMNKYICEI